MDPYQRYLTPLENKQNFKMGPKKKGMRKEKNLSKSKYDVNTKIHKSFEQIVHYGSIFMKPECNVCTLNSLCTVYIKSIRIECFMHSILACPHLGTVLMGTFTIRNKQCKKKILIY